MEKNEVYIEPGAQPNLSNSNNINISNQLPLPSEAPILEDNLPPELQNYMRNLTLNQQRLDDIEQTIAEYEPFFDENVDIGSMMNEMPDMFGSQNVDWLSSFFSDQASLMMESEKKGLEYVFIPENPYLNCPNPFQEGTLLSEQGNLNEAILAFEAEVQLRPNSSDAWRFLGTAQACNDDDRLAIAALIRSVEADPENIEALHDLGVSCTNELEQSKALTYLRNWISIHPEYKQILNNIENIENAIELSELERLIEIYIKATEIQPDDPDLYSVLGVLYNLSKEYEKAEFSFKEAIKLDPSDYSSWNKLGATQANSTRANGSADAVYCYRKALEIRPNYVRAWVNMGISYANQNMHDLSMKYYLKALSLNPKAEHVWNYMRMNAAIMKRNDLEDKINARDIEAFTDEFKFK